jgi:hypothetical protein
MAGFQLQTIKSNGYQMLLFVIGVFRPWLRQSSTTASITAPESVVAEHLSEKISFDEKMFNFLESLTKHFTARIESMQRRTDIAPVLLISIESAKVALAMIEQMKKDRAIIKDLADKYKVNGNVAGEEACAEVLKRYYGGFLINLRVIFKCNLKIMNLVATVHPNPSHKIFRERIAKINTELEKLKDDFIWQLGSESYFIYQIKNKVGSEWQERLLSDIIDFGDEDYSELLDNLTHGATYGYQQLIIKANKLKIASSLFTDELTTLQTKETQEGLNSEEQEIKKYVMCKISRLREKGEQIKPALEAAYAECSALREAAGGLCKI